MENVLGKIKGTVVVSVQAMPSEPLYLEKCMVAMMKSVINGGAGGLRVAGTRDIANAKKLFSLPIIGITKPDKIPSNFKEIVYITPTIKDVIDVINAGADIVAFDGTQRKRPNNEKLPDLIKYIHIKKKVAMADVSTIEEGLKSTKSSISYEDGFDGNFDLKDDSGSVYVYGLTATDLGYGAKNDKSFASLGLKKGDKITIIGYRGSFNSKIEVMYAYFVSKQ